jgi:hypothetical protein
LLRRLVLPFSSNAFACFAFGVVAVGWFVSLLFGASGTPMTRLRNFDTEPPSSYCYEFQPDNRLESVANAHTAADLHVRPDSLTALVRRTLGAANDLRDTAWLVSRNGNDSARVPTKTSRPPQNQAAGFAQSSKVLNLCTDSNRRCAVIILTIAQNKFTNCLR